MNTRNIIQAVNKKSTYCPSCLNVPDFSNLITSATRSYSCWVLCRRSLLFERDKILHIFSTAWIIGFTIRGWWMDPKASRPLASTTAQSLLMKWLRLAQYARDVQHVMLIKTTDCDECSLIPEHDRPSWLFMPWHFPYSLTFVIAGCKRYLEWLALFFNANACRVTSEKEKGWTSLPFHPTDALKRLSKRHWGVLVNSSGRRSTVNCFCNWKWVGWVCCLLTHTPTQPLLCGMWLEIERKLLREKLLFKARSLWLHQSPLSHPTVLLKAGRSNRLLTVPLTFSDDDPQCLVCLRHLWKSLFCFDNRRTWRPLPWITCILVSIM